MKQSNDDIDDVIIIGGGITCTSKMDDIEIENMNHKYPVERSNNNSIKIEIVTCRKMGQPANYVNNTNSLSAQIRF